MRLRKLKLAGFKSFVDPTTVLLPSDLIAVVGPNGCGKSNIIDAVRWVMGEISAKHLRGGTMADVVFNGSTTRKPVSQASVELVFDNSDGRLQGRMASYAEISLRREVSRDGQSAYYLNGVRCRRRDVMDVFLGTGLGPRSYAIIEQGMISRIIEARPEELREFLEEAAGISKYKERRRETENRIRHTKENLERLNDIRDELGRRLTHLKRQATLAERYRVLKSEERQLTRELQALRWQRLDQEYAEHQKAVGEQEVALEAAIAGQRRLEAQIVEAREAHGEATERYNQSYRSVLEAGASIARREEAIAGLKARREQLQASLQREREQLEQARSDAEEDGERRRTLEAQIALKQPELDGLADALEEARMQHEQCELAMQNWQTEHQRLADRASEPLRARHTEQARIEELQNSTATLDDRLKQLHQQIESIDLIPVEQRLLQTRKQLHEAEAALETAEGEQEHTETNLRRLHERIRNELEAVHALQERIQTDRGRESSLAALQQQALGKSRESVVEWMRLRGLAGSSRLAECIDVEAGWERAVESVLGHRLEAIRVDAVDAHVRDLGAVEGGSVTIFDSSARPQTVSKGPSSGVADGAAELTPMLALVQSNDDLSAWLEGVFVCSTLDEALQARNSLSVGQTIVTPEGVQLGARWAEVPDEGSANAGVLARARELESLSRAIDQSSAQLREHQSILSEAREAAEDSERELAQCRASVSARHRSCADLAALCRSTESELAQQRQRAETLGADRDEVRAQLARVADNLAQARERLTRSASEIEQLSAMRSQWEAQREPRRQAFEQSRTRHQSIRDRAYQLGVDLESLRGELEILEAGRRRSAERIEYMNERCAELAKEYEQIETPLAESQTALDSELERKRLSDEQQRALRMQVDAAEIRVRELETGRRRAEEEVAAARERLETLRLDGEQTRVRRQTLAESLEAEGHSPAALLACMAQTAGADAAPDALPPDAAMGSDTSATSGPASESAWAARLEELAKRISRLGAINLAAIDEYDQQSQRKAYLDEQHLDLDEALSTLTSAIQKIDRETRARFKDTFERVNTGLGQLFPRLFGGGQAELQLTDDDLLNAGISVMARPPGKRNSSIALLSGGEKALTAVALVFAIFELNPAPFCLLDEVDAPLDDANVGRYSELVKAMSERVQILLVTHNKLTMEAAHQLLGVTMHEPGVSRLVAVDIDEAAQFATA